VLLTGGKRAADPALAASVKAVMTDIAGWNRKFRSWTVSQGGRRANASAHNAVQGVRTACGDKEIFMASILVVVLIVLVAMFSVQNAGPVAISFFAWKFEASLAIVIFLVLLCGIVIGMIVSFWRGWSRKRRGKTARDKEGAVPPVPRG
jgi:uncharacterized integral membrane protein